MTPKSEKQNQIIRDERRDQILDHAMRLFTQKGYSATKISDIAQSAALSQGLVYHYFASKEEMFIAVVEQTIELSNDAMNRLSSMPLEPSEKMRAITEANLGFEDTGGYALRWLLMFQVGLTNSVPKRARDLMKERFVSLEFVKAIIEEGQRKGQFSSKKEASSLATAYWSLIEGLVFFKALNTSDLGWTVSMPDVETVMKILQ